MMMDPNVSYKSNECHSDEEFPIRHQHEDNVHYHEIFINECLQKIYLSGRLSGTRLLDFGCGPSVQRIISATRQFNDVILSDWSESNREVLEKWLRGDKDALDLTPVLERCAAAEGYRSIEVGVSDIERRVRKSVKKVVFCDALSKDILPEGLRDFDVINTSFCLECCCPSIEVYKEVLKKLVKYVKKGGAIVMGAALERKKHGTHNTLHVLYLTEEKIKDALKEAGLELRDWFYWRNNGKCGVNNEIRIAVFYSVKP